MMQRNHSVAPWLLFGLLLWCPGIAAFAQQPSQAQTAAIKQSCRADYQSYCSGVPTGGRASLQCLQQHQSELSQACHTAVAAVDPGNASPPVPGAAAPSPTPPPMSPRRQMGLMREACGADFRTYCHGVGLGGGRAMACLAANEQRLSPPCKGALAEARGAQ